MKIEEFAHLLCQSTVAKEAESVLQRYLNTFAINSYAFTYYSRHVKSGRKLRYHCVSKTLQPWHQHYLEQSYADVDRTLQTNHTMSLPLFWNVAEQLLQAKNAREQRIRKESSDYGIDQGLSIPVHGPMADFATLTLHQFKNETCLFNYQSAQYEWLAAAQLYYVTIKRILSLDTTLSKPSHLTRREEQCLQFTRESWRVEQIAKELKISVRTVNFHLQNANKKMGVHNKYQAAYQYFK